jgi:ubiquitin carboxyl-terminal hydrolase L3
MNTNIQWPALESDPEIFTKYAHSLGLKSNHVFNEIFSLDEEMLSMSQGSAVILCFTSNKVATPRSKCVDPKEIPFYMKQSGSLDLACGVIAILHCLGNVKGIDFEENSVLKKFFDTVKNMSPEERSAYLESCTEFKNVHSAFASEGQSNIPQTTDACEYHFIAYVNIEGKLYELDGLKKGPYLLEEKLDSDNIVPKVGAEIGRLLDRSAISENFAMMFLA